ncbi:MAG: hypothetical protein IPJ40_08060 [Saprospirales bacterium]|nr:hypothetical protein [Saprospirales bacterium]
MILQGHNTTNGVDYDIYWDNFCVPCPIEIEAKAWCDNRVDDANPFEYYIEITSASGGLSGNFSVTYHGINGTVTEVIPSFPHYVGPFNHSLSGGGCTNYHRF